MGINDIITIKPGCKTVVIGELLLDFIPKNTEMKLSDPGELVKTVSGSAGIYACMAAKLGMDCAFVGKVGRDAFSRLALSTVEAFGVDTDYVIEDERGQLGIAFMEYLPSGRNYSYYRENSAGSRLAPHELPHDLFYKAGLLHFPGMLLELNEDMRASCVEAVRLAKDAGALFSFDPNLRKELQNDPAALKRSLDMIALADVIEPTLDEARILTACDNLGDVLRRIHELGPKLVVLTCDKNGAIFSCGGTVWIASGIQVPVVDPTGAGDSFAAALAYCIQENMEVEQAIAFCNAVGTLVCTQYGTIGSALPTKEQIEALLKQNPCSIESCSLETL